MVDIRINDKGLTILKGMVGGCFEQYSCDPFIFTPNVFGIVGLQINGNTYKLTSMLEVVYRFFHDDDVAVLKIAHCLPDDVVSLMDGGQMIVTPVKDVITRIDVVNDREMVLHEGEQKELKSTKGIVFYLSSGNEISFEIGTWFSEMITVRRGYELIKQFTPTDEFIEEWDDIEGYTAECLREIISIK